MQMLHTFKQINPHKCQIDCTNHNQVINKLQLKSKDLYFFWRNYQWLYNRYYNQKQQEKKQPKQKQIVRKQVTIDYQSKFKQIQLDYVQLQNKYSNLNEKYQNLINQNRNLTTENQRLRQQTDAKNQQMRNLQNDYMREIQRLKSQVKEYEEMIEKLRKQNNQMKIDCQEWERRVQEEKRQSQVQKKKADSYINQLQQTIDEMRRRITNQPPPTIIQHQTPQLQGVSTLQYQKTIESMSSQLKKLKNDTSKIINQEIQMSKNQLMNQFMRMIKGLSQRQLEMIMVEETNVSSTNQYYKY